MSEAALDEYVAGAAELAAHLKKRAAPMMANAAAMAVLAPGRLLLTHATHAGEPAPALAVLLWVGPPPGAAGEVRSPQLWSPGGGAAPQPTKTAMYALLVRHTGAEAAPSPPNRLCGMPVLTSPPPPEALRPVASGEIPSLGRGPDRFVGGGWRWEVLALQPDHIVAVGAMAMPLQLPRRPKTCLRRPRSCSPPPASSSLWVTCAWPPARPAGVGILAARRSRWRTRRRGAARRRRRCSTRSAISASR